jgi:hypothetical protein
LKGDIEDAPLKTGPRNVIGAVEEGFRTKIGLVPMLKKYSKKYARHQGVLSFQIDSSPHHAMKVGKVDRASLESEVSSFQNDPGAKRWISTRVVPRRDASHMHGHARREA